jgi:hypothetical protein
VGEGETRGRERNSSYYCNQFKYMFKYINLYSF